MREITIILLINLLATLSFAQVGGKSSFQFLNVSDNARINGVGGQHVSTLDSDVNMMMANPGALDTIHKNHASVNYLPYFSTVNKSTFLYAFNAPKSGMWGTGITYQGYGEFEETDAAGNSIGEFKANDYSLFVTKSHRIDYFSFGGTMKFVGSSLAGFNSYAIAMDVGGIFIHPKHDLQIGMAFKNAGFIFNKFIDGGEQSMPTDLQVGASYKLEHMPLRFSITGYNLLQKDVYYFDAEQNVEFDENGDKLVADKQFSEQIFRRLIFGAELMFSRKFQIRVGYNHLRRKELRLEKKSGGAGFSIGGSLAIKGYHISYTRAMYHTAGGTSVLSVTTDLGRYFYKNVSKF